MRSRIIFIISVLREKNIIQNDITLKNLMLDEKGKVYIIDFGWANQTSKNKWGRLFEKHIDKFKKQLISFGENTTFLEDYVKSL